MGRKAPDMTGLQVGRLTVLRRVEDRVAANGHVYWECICECGTVKQITGGNLRQGNVQSCGCLRRETMALVQAMGKGWKGGNYKHGHAKNHNPSPTWISWYAMRKRCNNPDNPYYGGRGIDYDPRWDDFAVFVAEVGLRPTGKTLDRIDNDRGYWPGNVRWATPKEQTANRRPRRDV